MVKNNFSNNLIQWYKRNKRSMPWRDTNDFYKIWLSEIMLQQTQVKTAQKYYKNWIIKFPNIKSVSKSNNDIILKYWEGLGYYARVRNFKKACEYIDNNNIDVNEIRYKEFLKLPGVGIYTASAVFSIVKNDVYPVIDGNVKRVLSRLLRLNKQPDYYFKKMNNFLLKNISKKSPGDFNQALMELGSTLCKPLNPNCLKCPIKQYCNGYLKNDYLKYPIKVKKKIKPHYNFQVAIIWENNHLIISKRKPKGLLGGLWEFPIGKNKQNETFEECLKREIKKKINISINIDNCIGQINHEYSHFTLTLNVYECQFKGGNIKPIKYDDTKKIKLNNFHKFAFSKANHKIYKLLKNKYYN